MLAYRHAFHAGNAGDVLKHVVLVQVLRHMGEKDKPYTYLDTHAGAGAYSLDGRHARKTCEFVDGIKRLWGRGDLPPPVADYVSLVRRFNDGAKTLHFYPGSPALAQILLRPRDRMRLYEMHPTDHRILAARFARHPDTQIAHGDGFRALKPELPPPSRRGVVLIDPSYELRGDYARVVAALREALARFADAVVVIWYPQLALLDSSALARRLQGAAARAPKGWLHARLSLQHAGERGFGMQGSGVFVANPPHVLHALLQAALPFLVKVLGQHAGAHHLLEQHAA